MCLEQLAQITEARRFGLAPGINPKNYFKGKFQKVKKTFPKQNEEIICYHCNKEGHKRPDCEKYLAKKAKNKGHIMKRNKSETHYRAKESYFLQVTHNIYHVKIHI